MRPSHLRRCKLHKSTRCAEETDDGLLFPVGKGLPTLRAIEISSLARKRGTPLAHCQDHKTGIDKLIKGKKNDRPLVQQAGKGACLSARIWHTAGTPWLLNKEQIEVENSLSNRQAQGAGTQFSMFNLGTRPNSRVLFVTSVTPRLRAWAAMNRSFAPIIVPSVFRLERILA